MTKHEAARCTAHAALWIAVGLVLAPVVFCNRRVSNPEVDFGLVAEEQLHRVVLWALLAPVTIKPCYAVPLVAGHRAGAVTCHAVSRQGFRVGCHFARNPAPSRSSPLRQGPPVGPESEKMHGVTVTS